MIRNTHFDSPRFASILLTAALAGTPCIAVAATTCAGNQAEIQAALTTAGSSGGVNEIRIRTGAYSLSNVLFFAPTSDGSLTVSGGWNADCTAAIEDRAATVLDAGGVSQVFAVNAVTATVDVSLSNLTIQNGASTNTPGACVYVHGDGDLELAPQI